MATAVVLPMALLALVMLLAMGGTPAEGAFVRRFIALSLAVGAGVLVACTLGRGRRGGVAAVSVWVVILGVLLLGSCAAGGALGWPTLP